MNIDNHVPEEKSACPTGQVGPLGAGAIIPFASGEEIALSTAIGGILNTSSALGFGNTNTGIQILCGAIDLSRTQNFAFLVPRDGTITSLAAFFSMGVGFSIIGTTITITAQLYSAPPTSNIFTTVPRATATLSPPLTGLISLGDISNGLTSGLSIPVTAGTRLLLIFTPSVTAGLDIAESFIGYASAGLTIE